MGIVDSTLKDLQLKFWIGIPWQFVSKVTITLSIETTSRPVKLWVKDQATFWAAQLVAFITSLRARVLLITLVN